jgi:hypothetical protein
MRLLVKLWPVEPVGRGRGHYRAHAFGFKWKFLSQSVEIPDACRKGGHGFGLEPHVGCRFNSDERHASGQRLSQLTGEYPCPASNVGHHATRGRWFPENGMG